MLRKHQEELQRIAREIRTIHSIKFILAHVTPGGGKSSFAMILAAELAEKLGYKICWLVPRHALREQGEHDFVDLDKRALFGHTSQIRAAGNDIRPARDHIGYVTTYQAVVANPDLHRMEFERDKYILILDECHHITFRGEGQGDEAKYYAATAPLVERAKLGVFASGTLERHDKIKIAFLPYTRSINAEYINTSSEETPPDGWAIIRYSRKDALGEEAIVPLHFHVMDGRARWYDPKTNSERDVNSMAEAQLKDQPAILQTVLETEYAYQLIDRCIQSWKEYQEFVYPKAKLLVIAPGIGVAKDYCKYLQSTNHKALIATSDDTEEARRNIDRFKKDINILVTVGMAYEGLDVPEITHVALLTNIRSRPWIEQAICRGNRTDHANGKTHGYIFYPDDPRMKSIINAIDAEQAGVVVVRPPPPPPPDPPPPPPEPRESIAPLDSGTTRERGRGLEDGTQTDYDETRAIQEAMQQASIKGISVIQGKQFLVALGMGIIPNSHDAPDYQNRDVLTPSEMERRMDKNIHIEVSRYAKGDPDEIIRINKELKGMFGARGLTTVSVKQMILRYLYETYGEREAV